MIDNLLLLEDSLEELAEAKHYAKLREMFSAIQPIDIAILLESRVPSKLPIFFRLLPKELAAETFVEMQPETQELLIRSFSDAELKEVIDELYMDDAVDLVEEMPANVVKRILRQADSDMRRTINELLNYPEESAGSIMTTEFVSLHPTMSVGDAIKRIRRTGVDKETIYTCYVTENNTQLMGCLSLKTLLLSEEDEIISNLMETDYISVTTTDDQEEVALVFSKYDLNALPVVDHENRLVGIVTIDDAFDVLEEETTEDMEKMAAITPSDKPYLKMKVREIWLARIPWLLLLMVSATFTGMIISVFEDSLAKWVALTAFIPMLMDSGGNAGRQTSVTVIRALSVGDLALSDVWKVIYKEFRVSILVAFSLSMAAFVKIQVMDVWLLGNSDVTIGIAMVVCFTLAFTIIVAKVVGCTMPLLAKKLGFDPAVMASPFITTIVDALSLLIYFQIASLLLGI